MQYEITLPAGYDMGIIRDRVARSGRLLDDRAGLHLKAYLLRERGPASPVNQYAPFYLWDEPGAMAHFLTGGGGFQNIVRDFGRPPVRHWTVVAALPGPARGAPPRAASRLVEPVPQEVFDPDGMGLAGRVERETARLGELAGRAGVHTAALAVDPWHWSLVRFVLWARAVPEGDGYGERYQVLHLSAPGIAPAL